MDKLNKSGRKWKESKEWLPYRAAELFCEECGCSLGMFDIVTTNLESNMYCTKCVKKYIKDVPILLPIGVISEDFGDCVTIEYTNKYYKYISVSKICYFNKKGRYIKVKGKRYYI